MIRIFVGILILLSINEHINAQSDSLTVKLYDFFKSKNEMSENVKPRQTFLIINDLVTFKEFKSQEYGIFKFCTLTTHTFTHILLVNNTIVDMYQPLEKSLYSVLEYLKMNKNFSKEDIFRYIEGVLDLYRSNTESIPWSL
jgi:hypothetical protein